MLPRGGRFISRLKATRIPARLVFYDTESRREAVEKGYLHRFLLGYYQAYELRPVRERAAGGRLYRLRREGFFRDPERFVDVIETFASVGRRLWIMAHNQHFDYNILGLWRRLGERGYALRKIVIDSDVFMVEAVKGRKKLLFLDTLNYFKTSVSRLGMMFGLQKVELDFEKASEEELAIRCKRDVEIIARAMLELIGWWYRERLGTFGITAASLAMNAFRARFNVFNIERSSVDGRVDVEQRAYRGGRCEAFHIGHVKGPIYVLDINSMYPYVMFQHSYPRLLRVSYTNMTVESLRQLIGDYNIIADVHFSIPKRAVCVRRDKLICPVGEVREVLNTPELELVLKYGKINRVYKALVYEKAPLFREYVNYFYSLRKKYKAEGNEVYESFSKLMLNSLYGKFAQKVRELVEVERVYPEEVLMVTEQDAETGKITRLYRLGDKWYVLSEREEHARNVNIAIAAHVTAYARSYLWELIERAGEENVFYMDTDSLFVNLAGYERLKPLLGSELGQLKLSMTCENLTIYGPKDYICDVTEKLKGVPKDAIALGNGFYVYKSFLKTKSLLAAGIAEGVLEVEREKKLNRNYDKGIVLPDGRVLPFRFNDPL